MSKYNEDLDYLIQDVDISKEELEEIIAEADKIIADANSEQDKLIEAYLKKVQCLQKLGKYIESKEFIDKLLDFNPNMPEALVRLGNVYDENKEYDKAIDCISKAIKFNEKYAYAYRVRGGTYVNKGKYDTAIEDYSKAIELKPDYAATYFNRGNTKCVLFDYRGGIEDYSKAIEIRPNDANAYNNRGVVKCNLSDYLGAIEDYSKAIEINPDYAVIYNNRGNTYTKVGKYEEAAKDFEEARTDILNLLITLGEIEGKQVVNFMLDSNKFFIKEAVQKCEEKDIEHYKNIYIQSLSIISKLHIKKAEIEMPVSHYTKKEVAEKLLFNDYSKKGETRGNFRLSSINTSNDPEEGKTLFRYLFPKENMSSRMEEFGAFAGCFILNNDSLNQFRLYGKDEEEGTGVSIALNKHFFSDKISIGVEMKSESNKKEEISAPLLPLFRCIYIDPETDKVVSLGQKEKYVFYREKITKEEYLRYKKEIDDLQEKISDELDALKKQISNLNRDIVSNLLLNLRYLVKHAAFKEEQECRIIKIKELTDSEIQSEKGRLYINYLNLNNENVEKICFGPKAKDMDKFKLHLVRNYYSGIECYRSISPLA